IFGKAATACLTHALRKTNDKIIGLPVDFSRGPIKNIHQENGIKRYFFWVKSTYDPMWRSFTTDDEMTYMQACQQLLEIKHDTQVKIWLCENANEQFGLRIVTYLLKDKDVNLATINTYQAMCNYTKHIDTKIDIRHTGDC